MSSLKTTPPKLLDALVLKVNQLTAEIGLATRANFAVFSQQIQSPTRRHLIFVDQQAKLLVRLGNQRTNFNQELKMIRSTQQAISLGAPFSPPITSDVYPVKVDQLTYWASYWNLANNRPIRASEMASTLAQIHQTQPPNKLPKIVDRKCQLLKTLANDIQSKPELDPKLVSQINLAIKSACDKLERLAALSELALVHGDAHPANFIEQDGQIVACDSDKLAIGPPEADFAPLQYYVRYLPADSIKDQSVCQRLIDAYPNQLNLDLLEAFVQVKALDRLRIFTSHWHKPDILENFKQRWQTISRNKRFESLLDLDLHLVKIVGNIV